VPKNGQKPKPSGWPAYTSSAHRKGETILRGWVVFSAAPAGARGGAIENVRLFDEVQARTRERTGAHARTKRVVGAADAPIVPFESYFRLPSSSINDPAHWRKRADEAA
jgi:hypothetical protein